MYTGHPLNSCYNLFVNKMFHFLGTFFLQTLHGTPYIDSGMFFYPAENKNNSIKYNEHKNSAHLVQGMLHKNILNDLLVERISSSIVHFLIKAPKLVQM